MKNLLPCQANNLVNNSGLDRSSKRTSKRLSHLFLVMTRTLCSIIFLNTLIEHKVIPNYVNNLFRHFPFQDNSNDAMRRKVTSLKMEILRTTMTTKKEKLKKLEKELGYEYLNVIRSTPTEFCAPFLDAITKMLHYEEKLIYQRHTKK